MYLSHTVGYVKILSLFIYSLQSLSLSLISFLWEKNGVYQIYVLWLFIILIQIWNVKYLALPNYRWKQIFYCMWCDTSDVLPKVHDLNYYYYVDIVLFWNPNYITVLQTKRINPNISQYITPIYRPNISQFYRQKR